jgi:Serpentine type 7TM GPCR chemoreceptor Srt
MEQLLFHHDTFQLHYNCSFYSTDAIPLAERQHVRLGIAFIVLFVVFELIYLPILVVLRRHLQQSCYKQMFFIGMVDVVCMAVNGLMTGLWAIQGVVYCDSPTLQLIAASVGNGQ